MTPACAVIALIHPLIPHPSCLILHPGPSHSFIRRTPLPSSCCCPTWEQGWCNPHPRQVCAPGLHGWSWCKAGAETNLCLSSVPISMCYCDEPPWEDCLNGGRVLARRSIEGMYMGEGLEEGRGARAVTLVGLCIGFLQC